MNNHCKECGAYTNSETGYCPDCFVKETIDPDGLDPFSSEEIFDQDIIAEEVDTSDL